jgi:two-component system LytT family sensor kinase
MPSSNMRISRVVALALVVGTFFVAQEVLTDLANGRHVRVVQDLVVVLLFWAVWACLTPAILVAVRRWPLDARPVYRPLLAHAAIAVILAAAYNVIIVGVRSVALVLRGGIGLRDALMQTASLPAFVWGLFTGAFFYAVVVIVYAALRYRGLYAAEQISAAALEMELTQTKLDTLRSQLRPHFLFNTLNAISVLVTEDADKAQQMLLRLATLLRRSLDERAQEVPLQQELGFASDYLDIQRGRFGDQLALHFAIDPAVLNASVPVFLLQPLLENAIEHGWVDGRRTAIALAAGRVEDLLYVALEDDGPGVAGNGPVHEGIGLGNTRARLLHLYGTQATVALGTAHRQATWRGASVEIRIPYRETPA